MCGPLTCWPRAFPLDRRQNDRSYRLHGVWDRAQYLDLLLCAEKDLHRPIVRGPGELLTVFRNCLYANQTITQLSPGESNENRRGARIKCIRHDLSVLFAVLPVTGARCCPRHGAAYTVLYTVPLHSSTVVQGAAWKSMILRPAACVLRIEIRRATWILGLDNCTRVACDSCLFADVCWGSCAISAARVYARGSASRHTHAHY